jgi:hypothetical protein
MAGDTESWSVARPRPTHRPRSDSPHEKTQESAVPLLPYHCLPTLNPTESNMAGSSQVRHNAKWRKRFRRSAAWRKVNEGGCSTIIAG